MKTQKLKTQEIIELLTEQNAREGLNWRNWNTQQKADYIYSNFICSKYVAKNAAILY